MTATTPLTPPQWAENCTRLLGFAPDGYSHRKMSDDRFAACLGCRHVLVDKGSHNCPGFWNDGTCEPAGVLGHSSNRLFAAITPSGEEQSAPNRPERPRWRMISPRHSIPFVCQNMAAQYWEGERWLAVNRMWQADEFATIARN